MSVTDTLISISHESSLKKPEKVSLRRIAKAVKELEADIAKRPAKPLYGEARSLLLKAMDNSADVDDAIEKYEKLKERIKELETQLKEEYNKGIKDGLNQAAEIVKNC